MINLSSLDFCISEVFILIVLLNIPLFFSSLWSLDLYTWILSLSTFFLYTVYHPLSDHFIPRLLVLLVSKSEIQPFIPLRLRRLHILLALSLRPAIPNPVPPRINPFVVEMDQDIDNYIRTHHANQGPVSVAIPRLVVLAIHVGGGDARGLRKHVVYCSRDRPASDGVRVARVPADLDCVRGRIREEQGSEGPDKPSTCRGVVDDVECDEERKSPDLAEHGGEGQRAGSLREPG